MRVVRQKKRQGRIYEWDRGSESTVRPTDSESGINTSTVTVGHYWPPHVECIAKDKKSVLPLGVPHGLMTTLRKDLLSHTVA